jgi:hypothetical protein
MAYNVLAVCDVFLCAIEKLRSNFSAQKNVAEKIRTKGVGLQSAPDCGFS